MGTTTRRVTDEELDRIKSIQTLLETKGIKISQTELTAFMTEYVIENYEEFVELIIRHQDVQSDDYQRFKGFLFRNYPGKEAGDSVEEHDVII